MNMYVTKERLIPILDKAFETKKPRTQTIECQVTLKNYDFKKDVRFDSNCHLPFPKRAAERILVIADNSLVDICVANNLQYVLTDDIKGNTKDKIKMKKKLCKKYHAFIGLQTYSRFFEMRIFAAKNKPVYTIKSAGELLAMYKDVQNIVKFKLRKSVNMHFCCGHTEMEKEQVAENISTALLYLVGLLKKGMQNIDTIFIKNTQGSSIKLYG
ncbi:hypothetical protein EDEG_01597 [Edhazardia aedis USNM 41457]|uniref:Ribosomal protein L1 n=1 Tax=Edhazardia aedis (strain USNM 41457) TaxID=1003232 RepID=J9DS47_EDHAE|nr:hypothetical protein EDEG_01597 [Edhazardia aedis USNM 41457]|eukprot:EJW04117.1 hypothetical protein EDEG_01597 [Edhazardia aedis USNM 41457]